VGGAAALGCSAWSNVDEFLNEITARIYTQSAAFPWQATHIVHLSFLARRLCKFQTARREFLFDKGRPRLEGERSLSEKRLLNSGFIQRKEVQLLTHILLISVNCFKCAIRRITNTPGILRLLCAHATSVENQQISRANVAFIFPTKSFTRKWTGNVINYFLLVKNVSRIMWKILIGNNF